MHRNNTCTKIRTATLLSVRHYSRRQQPYTERERKNFHMRLCNLIENLWPFKQPTSRFQALWVQNAPRLSPHLLQSSHCIPVHRPRLRDVCHVVLYDCRAFDWHGAKCIVQYNYHSLQLHYPSGKISFSLMAQTFTVLKLTCESTASLSRRISSCHSCICRTHARFLTNLMLEQHRITIFKHLPLP